jgi:hypothetical protein
MDTTGKNENKNDQSTQSVFHKGISDYGDGANVTHHLGNDEYKEGSNLPDDNEVRDNPRLQGKVAEGNEFMEEEDLASEKDKRDKENLRS